MSVPQLSRQDAIRLLLPIANALAIDHLEAFVRLAWPILNPGRPLKWSWHMSAICAHLEAVSDGRIGKIVINLPPGYSKTTIITICWPIWVWLRYPEKRFITASYADDLARKASKDRGDVLRSPWYQELMEQIHRSRDLPKWRISHDTQKEVENSRSGFMLATSVDGQGTGRHADFIVCFPEDEVVWTENGKVPIGELVENRTETRVWSYDTETEEVSLQPIEGWHQNPGRDVVEVGFDDGTAFRCTPDHQVWTRNRGWARADSLGAGDVLPGFAGTDLPNRSETDAEPPSEIRSAQVGVVEDEEDIFLGQPGGVLGLTPLGVAGFPELLGKLPPSFSAPDLVDGHAVDVVAGSEHHSGFVTGDDVQDVFLLELCVVPILPLGNGSVPLGVVDVLLPRPVGEIVEPVVGGVPVEMANLQPFGAWADESRHHGLMDAPGMRPTTIGEVESVVPAGIARSFEDLLLDPHRTAPGALDDPGFAADPPLGGRAVLRPVGDRRPSFVRHVGYSSATYCLSVATNHTMFVSDHPTCVRNCDDPLKAKDVYTIKLQQHVTWFRETLRSRVTDVQDCAFVIVMQRLHDDELSGVLIKDPSWDHLRLPAEYNPDPKKQSRSSIGWKDPRTVEGEPLFPARFPRHYLDEQKGPFGLGPIAFAAQQNQDPIAGLGNVFQRNWWRFWTDDPTARIAGTERLPEEVDELVGSWDMSFKAAIDSGFVVGQMWARKDANFYLLDQVRARLGFGDTRTAFRNMRDKWPMCTRWLVEEKANGAAIIDELKSEIPGIIPVVPTESKDARAAAVSSYVQSGNVYVPSPQMVYAVSGESRYPWVSQLLDECSAFPQSSLKDQVDTLTQALRDMTYRLKRAMGWTLPEPLKNNVSRPRGRQLDLLKDTAVERERTFDELRAKAYKKLRKMTLPQDLPSALFDPTEER